MSSLSLEILEKLIGFETVSSQSNLPLIAYVQDFLTARGFRVTRLQDPDEPKAGLYAEIGPPGPGLLLSAHSDVVPVVGQKWTRPTFRLTSEGDRLYGRGTTDMKGFLAEMLACADRVSKMHLSEPLKLVVSYDEEVACRGIARMWNRLTPLIGQPRMALIGEPTEMQVVLGHKGKRAYRARVAGEAGHSALAPRFASALYAATDFVGQLRLIQAQIENGSTRDEAYDVPYTTVHVGRLNSGTALNIVPDVAELLFEFRHLAEEDPHLLAQQIRSAAADVCGTFDNHVSIEIEETSAYPSLETSPESWVAITAKRIVSTESGKVAFGTEAGFFAKIGIPSIVCGPGSMEGQGHKPDEFVSRSQLKECEEVLTRFSAVLIQ